MKKKLFLILNLIVITFMAIAQPVSYVPPQAIPYQGIARNASGSILASQNISLRISIHDGVPTGTILFSETHHVTTTSLGLFNLNIGMGTAITGTLFAVDWSGSAKHIQVELDPLGGSNFTDMGTTQLNSVPYALFAGKTASLPDGSADGNTLRWTGSSWLPNNIIHNDGVHVGIGTTDAQAKLDINGDIAMRSADITIGLTYNTSLDVNTVKQTNYKLLQSFPGIGNFIIAGITSGSDGRVITLANRSGSSMEIYNDDAIAPATDRIITGTGTTFAIYNGGSVSLRYDVSIQKWEVMSSHYNSLDYFGGGGSGTSYWDLTGADVHNNNSGNVAIGATASNGYKLLVKGNGSFEGNTISKTGFLYNGGGLEINSNNVTGYQYLKMDGQTIQSLGNTNSNSTPVTKNLLLNPFSGNVGINYSTPLATLVVKKASNTSSPEGSLSLYGTTHASHFHYSTTEDTYIRGGKDGSKVIINDGPLLGNVGIGLSNPRCKLTILSNTVMGNSNTEVLQIAGKNALAIFSDENGSDYGYIKAVTDNTQTPDFTRAGLLMGVSSGNLYLSTNYSPILTINGLTNNVGIGTVNPTQKLSVNGTIRSKEIIVEAAPWADYVFDEKYQLPNLDSIANYIKANKHLPGIPSAKEIEANGLKVGEVQTKMMEKIEELTLYVIELKKEIELLKKQTLSIKN